MTILAGDLLAEQRSISAVLDMELSELAKYGRQKAEATAAYYAAKAKRVLELRESGVAATLVPSLAKGDKEVAARMLEKDIAEVMYDVTRESIYKHKIDLNVVKEQHAREWSTQRGNQ